MTILFDRNGCCVLLAATSLSLIVLTRPAFALEEPTEAASPTGATSEGDSVQLQEVLVIADKQQINLQRAPQSITALKASTLDVANIRSPDDLNGFVPGLTLAPNEGENRVASIRGIGNEANQNGSAQPAVAYHVDGVYVASAYALSGDFLDIDRIDVLRKQRALDLRRETCEWRTQLVRGFGDEPLLGAVCGAGVLPFRKTIFQEIIKKSGMEPG